MASSMRGIHRRRHILMLKERNMSVEMGSKEQKPTASPDSTTIRDETNDIEGDELPPTGSHDSQSDIVTQERNIAGDIDEDAKTETIAAITERPNIRSDWTLMAVFIFVVAALYIKQPSQTQLDLLGAKLDTMKISHGKDFSEDIEALDKKLGEIDAEKLFVTLETFIKRVEDHGDRIKDAEVNVEDYDTVIHAKAKELSDRMKTASATLGEFDDNIKKMKDKVSNVAGVVIILILAMNFGLIVAVFFLCQGGTHGVRQNGPTGEYNNPVLDKIPVAPTLKKATGVVVCQGGTRRVGSRQPHGVRQNSPTGEYYNPVLDQIPFAPTLKKAIGVISFTREYQPGHRHLIRSVTDIMGGGHNIDVEYHVILTDEDITNIPRCSLIVICVEYSDRDVIIEESGYGLGDCNKTTLAAALKIEAIPVIVYCKDLSSQRLQPGRLFNERIRCATRQKELIPISVNNRFFSVYDDFSKNQKSTFQQLITDHVLKK